MSPEHFCMWLQGYLDGNDLMDEDIKAKLLEKLETVGQAPAKAQPKNDKPKTIDPAEGYFRGITTDLLARPSSISLASGTVGVGYDPAMTTMCVNSANVGSASEAH
jgi:hypothetical protein